MILFDAATRTFNLVLAHSFYAFRAEPGGRLLHLAWGPRPTGTPDGALLTQGYALAGIASFEWQTGRDELVAFGDTTYHEVSLKASFPSIAPESLGAGETAHIPVRDVRLRYVDHEVVEDARPGLAPEHGLPVRDARPRETLRVRLADPVQPFETTLCYRLIPEFDIIERWCEYANSGPETVTLEVVGIATLHLPNGTSELTSVNGGWAREFAATRERLPVGLRALDGRTLQTGHEGNPFFMLNRPGQAWEETGTVYFGALAYSGAWRIACEQFGTLDLRVHATYHPADFRLEMAPGSRHATPALVIGACPDGWGGASRRLQGFARARVLPRPASTAYRPVLYNSWEATFFDLSFEGQLKLARLAARIGVELFCVDDGWFGGRRHAHAGLGDWTVSPKVFPKGLEPLVAEVHGLGMQFGLWVEPEMVNPNSRLYRRHPEWALHFPGRPRTESRSQLILDLGRPEVVDYLREALHELVARYHIDFLKWDMNRNVTEPGSAAGRAIWLRHVEALYEIMDGLRRAHPQLQIESCSGGGGRIDLGVLSRTDQVWTSDNTDAMDRLRIQEGFSLCYPARAMEAWVTHAHNLQTGRVASLGLRFDVAMRGALGIGSRLDELDDAELAEYASHIRFYKRIRPVVQEGIQYRLQRLEEYGASVWEYVLPDAGEAVYSIAVREHQIGWVRPPAPLRGLDPAATYAATDRRGKRVHLATGYELMVLGIPDDARAGVGYSRTLHFKRQ